MMKVQGAGGGGAIQEFLFQMSVNGRRASSVVSYARELALLHRHLCHRPLAAVTAHDVSHFLASPPARLRRDGSEKAVTTQNRTKVVIRAFFAWCKNTDRIGANPASLVKAGTTCAPLVGYMTRREMRQFLAGIRGSAHRLARRDHALFATMAYTGIRLSEVARAAWSDLDVRRRRLLLRVVKGGHAETRHVPRRLFQILLAHRRTMRYASPEDGSPMFCSNEHEALSPRGVQYRFAFWLARSGIRRRMPVHSLRHYPACRVIPTRGGSATRLIGPPPAPALAHAG